MSCLKLLYLNSYYPLGETSSDQTGQSNKAPIDRPNVRLEDRNDLPRVLAPVGASSVQSSVLENRIADDYFPRMNLPASVLALVFSTRSSSSSGPYSVDARIHWMFN